MPSVLTLHLRPEAGHQVLARVFDGKQLVGTPTLHPGIDLAITAYGHGHPDVPGVTGFDIWYGGWSVGVTPLAQMQTQAQELARRLVVLSAVLR